MRALLYILGSTRAVLILIAICAAALLLSACGPSDTDAMQDTAADLQEAPQQARAEIHQAQALALMAASGNK
jgi:outer membrane lipoprotein-sorting protein